MMPSLALELYRSFFQLYKASPVIVCPAGHRRRSDAVALLTRAVSCNAEVRDLPREARLYRAMEVGYRRMMDEVYLHVPRRTNKIVPLPKTSATSLGCIFTFRRLIRAVPAGRMSQIEELGGNGCVRTTMMRIYRLGGYRALLCRHACVGGISCLILRLHFPLWG